MGFALGTEDDGGFRSECSEGGSRGLWVASVSVRFSHVGERGKSMHLHTYMHACIRGPPAFVHVLRTYRMYLNCEPQSKVKHDDV